MTTKHVVRISATSDTHMRHADLDTAPVTDILIQCGLPQDNETSMSIRILTEQIGNVREAKRLTQLEKEHDELKTLVAELSLDNRMLKDINGRKW